MGTSSPSLGFSLPCSKGNFISLPRLQLLPCPWLSHALRIYALAEYKKCFLGKSTQTWSECQPSFCPPTSTISPFIKHMIMKEKEIKNCSKRKRNQKKTLMLGLTKIGSPSYKRIEEYGYELIYIY